jgi:hypothetical protein
MGLTPPIPSSVSPPARQSGLPVPQGDSRLLTPGWSGELAPDEFEYILSELLSDKRLAFTWGFQPGKKRRPEWSIRAVAVWGDPERRATNMVLARQKMPEAIEIGI